MTTHRRLILPTGAMYALGKTKDEVRTKIFNGSLRALVYDQDGTKLVPYTKSEKVKHSAIYIDERSLSNIVNPLPPPSEDAPSGPIFSKRGAATFLNRTPHWIHALAEKGTIPAYVYKDGINLIPLSQALSRRGRVLHFRKADLEEYKRKIEEYKTQPRSQQRASLELSEQQKEQIIALVNNQMKERGYVSMRPIRIALALPSNTYDDALRRLREEHGWPMSYKQQQVSKSRAKKTV